MEEDVPAAARCEPPARQRDSVARAHAEDPLHEPAEELGVPVGVRGHGGELADHLGPAEEGPLRRLGRFLLLRAGGGEAAEGLGDELEREAEAVEEGNVAEGGQGVRAADGGVREEVRELGLLPQGLRPCGARGGAGGTRKRCLANDRVARTEGGTVEEVGGGCAPNCHPLAGAG